MATAKKRCREEHPRRNCPALFYARPIIISIISLISRPPACKVCPSLDLIKKTTALTDQTLQLCGEMMPLVSSLAMLSNDGKHLSSNDAEPVHEGKKGGHWHLCLAEPVFKSQKEAEVGSLHTYHQEHCSDTYKGSN